MPKMPKKFDEFFAFGQYSIVDRHSTLLVVVVVVLVVCKCLRGSPVVWPVDGLRIPISKSLSWK